MPEFAPLNDQSPWIDSFQPAAVKRSPAAASGKVQTGQRLQRALGNQGMQRIMNPTETIPTGAQNQLKTTGTAGGLTGLNLDVTFNVTDTPADSLQAIQAFMGTRRTDGVKVGKYSYQYQGKTWDAFVDGGKNSPYVTMTGNPPAHPTNPYYLTPAEVTKYVSWSTDHGTIRLRDAPGAVLAHEEAYFETAVVAVNHKGSGKDMVLKAFKWGWTGKGTKAEFGKGTEIAGKASGIQVIGSVTPEWKNIVKNDYPAYVYS